MKNRIAASLTAVTLAVAASAAFAADADISVVGAWSRATSGSATTGAAYLTIVDKGAADKLVGVSTPVATTAKVHQTVKTGAVFGMRPVDSLPVSSSGPLMLAPGGYHIMLMGLTRPLAKGETFPLTLTFEKAGKVETQVSVEAAGAGGPMQDMGPGHDMDAKGPPAATR